MIPAKLLLRLAKTSFHFPAAKGHSQQLSQRPAAAPGNSVADKVFHLAGANIGRDNQRTLGADKMAIMSLAITKMPPYFPDLRPLMRITHTVPLRCLAC